MPAKTTNITDKFLKYLSELGISPKSHKNYKSDLSHFSKWFLSAIRKWGVFTSHFPDAIPFITNQTAHDYRQHLIDSGVATKTINRRLSTLRHLSRFLTATQILDFDFMKKVKNISLSKSEDPHPFLPQFENYLSKEKASSNTIKNYMSDIKQFLEWADKKAVKTN